MFDKLYTYIQLPFVQYAIIVGVLIALCSSLLGVTLVLKRFSFIGDGLSHVAFGTMAVATVVGMTNEMFLVMPVTIIAAIFLLKGGNNRKVKGDAALAMVSVGTLAFGYLVINRFSKSSNVSGDVCSTLFGSTSILTLSPSMVWMCIILSVVVVLIFVLFYNRIFHVTFDEDFAIASGTRAGLYNLVVSVTTAVVISLAMNLVGSLLISALIIFPALSAMRICRNYKAVTIASVIISVVCALIGLIVSILAGTPVGSTIVAVDAVMFGICFVLGFFLSGRRA